MLSDKTVNYILKYNFIKKISESIFNHKFKTGLMNLILNNQLIFTEIIYNIFGEITISKTKLFKKGCGLTQNSKFIFKLKTNSTCGS